MVPQGPTPGNQALTHSEQLAGGAELTAAPEVRDALVELLQHDVSAWSARGLATQKERSVRRVFRGVLAGVDVHIKVFRADTIAAKARDALRRRHKGEREAAHLRQALDAGLPAVEPLAYGLARDGGGLGGFVVTRTVDAAPLTLPGSEAGAEAAGRTLRHVHDLGLQPGDLHPGNLLIGPDGAPVLCDLTAMQRAGAMSARRRAAGLAFFCNPTDGGPLDPSLRALLRGYLAEGPMPAGFRAELARATRQLRATSIRSFGRRSQRDCRHTEVEPRRRATPRWCWFVGDDGVDDALRTATAAFCPEEHAPRRLGRRGGVWLTDAFAVKQRDQGKAQKLWRAHYWLLFAEVPTAPPLALRLHEGQGRVFVRRIDGPDLSAELTRGDLDEAAVARAARALGRAVGRLHAHGLRNRDLKFDNLVRRPGTDEVLMVDLDGVTLHSAQDTRGCGRDLGRLLAAWQRAGEPGGPTTLARFVCAYVRTRRRLLQQPPVKRILKHAERRAREWQVRHA
ncbi:MAG: hypothetical protein ACON4Z_03570 [Planctomycetota bacterium]